MHKLITHSFALYTVENILKNSKFLILVGISQLSASRENKLSKKLKTQKFIQKLSLLSRDYFASKAYLRNSFRESKAFFASNVAGG